MSNNTSSDMENEPECCICYDALNTGSSANTCVTTCGHKYCMGCFIKCIQCNNSCPICRNELYVKTNKNDEDDDEDITIVSSDEEEDEEDEEEEEEDTNDTNDEYDSSEGGIEEALTLEMIMERFQNEGITYKDLLRCKYWYHRSDNPEYNGRRNKSNISNKMAKIVSVIYNEMSEINAMEGEDLRSKYVEIQNAPGVGIAGMASVISTRVENILIPRRRMR